MRRRVPRKVPCSGGPVISGLQASVVRGTLHIQRRRLGGRAVGSSCASKLYRVSRGD